MKLARLGGMAVGVVLGGIAGILLTTNPNRQDYEQYASQRLTSYLKDNVCARAQASSEMQALLRGYCKMLVDTGHPFLQEAIPLTPLERIFSFSAFIKRNYRSLPLYLVITSAASVFWINYTSTKL
jgi:uncharacterized protein YceK